MRDNSLRASYEKPRSQMRLLITGGTGVLGRSQGPLAVAAGHETAMPGHEELDLFDPSAVADTVRDVDGVVHLATRIRSLDQISDPDVWLENDRRRAKRRRTRRLARSCQFCALRSALVAEREAERFARAGGRAVVLRFGLLDGPGTWFDEPMGDFGATLHVGDAGRALLSALSLPSGIYNVCRDGERVLSERLARAAGWHPRTLVT